MSQSIIEDFASIGSRLAEIEKIPAKDKEAPLIVETASAIATSWMSMPVVWSPEQGYADTAPSELVPLYVAPDHDGA